MSYGGKALFTYAVTDRDTGISHTLKITEADMIRRYGDDWPKRARGTPSPMFIKDKACCKGLFGWDRYNRLSTKKLK